MNRQLHLLWLLALAALVGPQVSADAQSAKAFEVASIRPHTPGADTGQLGWRVAGNRLDLSSVSARLMISRAFGIPQARIVGAPDWAVREALDIRAIMPAGATERDALEMLKTLLAERFAFKAHVEQRPYPVYELSVAPSGPRFPEVEAVDELEKDLTGGAGKSVDDHISGSPTGEEVRSFSRSEPDGVRFVTVTRKTRYSYKLIGAANARQVEAERITMEEFSFLLYQSVDRPVVDMTGLKGIYRFNTLLPPIPLSARMLATLGDRVSADPPGGPSLRRALEELGLKLAPKNTPVDFIVIDRIERPTPN